MPEYKKSIIFCAPSDFGLFEAFKRDLENFGFDVIGFPIEDGNYKYPNIFYRIKSSFKKIFLNDRDFKNQLKLKQRGLFLSQKISKIDKVDYALFIRPDMYPIDFIEKVKKKSTITVAYQWDSINKFPTVINYLNLFDRFFVFDEKDHIQFPHTEKTTNFYLADQNSAEQNNNKTAYLIGSCDADRINESILLKKILQENNYDCDFTLKTNKRKQIEILSDNGIKTIHKAISYLDNLSKVKSSALAIDLHNPRQSGLSFRVFECLNYQKKLITTNPHVKNYDFYHPNNIFVWTKENSHLIPDFLQAEYEIIPNEIVKNYSFENWIKSVFSFDNYTKTTSSTDNN